MKILYTISHPYGPGADRWIYEGYKDAFLAEGHEFFSLSETDNFQEIASRIKPDIFMIDFCFLKMYIQRSTLVLPEFLNKLRSQGTKIFCLVGPGGIDRDYDGTEWTPVFQRYLGCFDICFSNYAPEATQNFEPLFNKKLYFIPHAANTRYYFLEKQDPKFACDIAFVGSFYTQKKEQFERLLFPLLKKYRARVYGTGWTRKDRLLRLGSGLARRLKTKKC